MAGFRKAKAEQAALKIGLYGPAGSGKTFTALLLAEGLAALDKKRVAVIDTERGTDFYCQRVPTRTTHQEAFDFDALYTRSLTEMLAAARSLKPEECGVLVLDSITHAWEAAIAAYSGRTTSVGTIPFQAWGKIKKPYKDLMAFLLATPMHVLICGRERNVYQEDEETEELKMVGKTMRAEGETPYEPHILIRMESRRPNKTNEIAQIIAYAEKDRTGVLAGRSFINPTFDTLCRPLLGLLGKKQADMGTPEEVANKDAEELAAQEEQREAKSKEIVREYSARVSLCKTAKELKDLAKQITPALKSEMLPAHVAALREAYQGREQELARNSADSSRDDGGTVQPPIYSGEAAE